MKQNTDDLISREKALEVIEDWERCYTWDEHCRESKEDYIVSPSDVIVNLPSAQRWIPVTLETLPNPNSVVVVCGEKGTWDYGTYRGWHGDIHSWNWKKNTNKDVYWWMYKADALPKPWEGEQDGRDS